MKSSIKLTEISKFDPKLKKEAEKETEAAIQERNDVNQDQLEKIWNDFIIESDKKENSNVSRLLRGRKIRVKGTEIIIEFENDIQIHKLNDFKEELMYFMRSKAKNGSISLNTQLVEREEKQVIYTSQQKYKVLVEKYPIIEQLKDRFGLDLEF